MITLNIDKGLVKFESWEELEAYPGFIPNLNPSEHKLKAIIGKYIHDNIKCGLSDCHTPHRKGYIVETMDGKVTNIGHKCGKREFGVDFDTLSRRLERDIAVKENRETLRSFGAGVGEIEKKIAELRGGPRGADWVRRMSVRVKERNKGCPDAVVGRLSSMTKARSSALTRSRLATEREIEQLRETQQKRELGSVYVEEKVGDIRGLEALYPENDLRELLIKDLDARIREFKAVDIESLSHSDLVRWVKWVGTVDETLERAERALIAGKHLLTPENFGQFMEVLESREKNQLREFMGELTR